MQVSASSWVSMAVTNSRSGLGLEVAEASHCTGVPVPWGKTATKPSFCPSDPNMVVVEWMTAPSDRRWKSTTSGLGMGAPAAGGRRCAVEPGRVVGEGVLRRYHRDVCRLRWSGAD